MSVTCWPDSVTSDLARSGVADRTSGRSPALHRSCSCGHTVLVAGGDLVVDILPPHGWAWTVIVLATTT